MIITEREMKRVIQEEIQKMVDEGIMDLSKKIGKKTKMGLAGLAMAGGLGMASPATAQAEPTPTAATATVQDTSQDLQMGKKELLKRVQSNQKLQYALAFKYLNDYSKQANLSKTDLDKAIMVAKAQVALQDKFNDQDSEIDDKTNAIINQALGSVQKIYVPLIKDAGSESDLDSMEKEMIKSIKVLKNTNLQITG